MEKQARAALPAHKPKPTDQMTTSCPSLGSDAEVVRPKALSQSCVLSSLNVAEPNENQDPREEKIQKWKQAGGALRRALSKITRPRKKSRMSGQPPKKTCKRVQKKDPSQEDPMNAMLAEFQSNSNSRTSAESSVPKVEATTTPSRPLSTFAELKEKIKRMTSSSEKRTLPSSKKRHKILRHSKSLTNDGIMSSESESDDFRMQRPYKASVRKEKRQSLDDAAFSVLRCGISAGVSNHLTSRPLCGPMNSEREVPTSTPSNPPSFHLHDSESFANLADVESSNSNSEGEISSDELYKTARNVQKWDSDDAHTLCSTSEDEQTTAEKIRKEKYKKDKKKESPNSLGTWLLGDLELRDEGSDDESDLFDDLPDLRIHLPNSSSSDEERNPMLIDRLPSLISLSSSSEENEEGVDADDEFECDCPLCRFHRGANPTSTWTPTTTSGEEQNRRSLFRDSDEEIAQARQFASMLLGSQNSRRDSVLDLMFQNVILQMLSVYPDLLNDQAPPPVSAALFSSLPNVQVDSHLLDKDAACPICLCNFELEEEAKLLPCQHHFHTLCIQAWLKKSGTCPVCRHVLAAKPSS